METFEKVDGATLKVIKTPEAKNEEKTYDVEFLKQQEVSILKQKNDYVEARNLELAEVRALLEKCEELGIKPKVEVELAEEMAEEAI